MAKSMSDRADLVIIDRSFSSISLVPRIIMGAWWTQFAFDLAIDNYRMSISEVIQAKCPKILLIDPTVIQI